MRSFYVESRGRAFAVLAISVVLLRAAALAANRGDGGGDYTMRTWSVEDGLPDSTVTVLAQTSEGYLWVGTPRGLARTDGVRFVVFNPGEPITALTPDPTGALWIGSNDGALLRVRNGVSEPVISASESRCGSIHALAAAGDALHIGAENGWFQWSATEGLRTVAESNQVGSVFALAAGESARVWAGTSKGVWRFEHGTVEPSAPRNVPVHALSVAPDGTIRLASETSGLLEIQRATDAPRRIWPVSRVGTFTVLRNGDIWVTGERGRIERIVSGQSTVVVETPAASVRGLLEDREGNVWIGTEGAGLIQIRPKVMKLLRARGTGGVVSCTEGPAAEIWFAGRNGRAYRSHGGTVEQRSFANHPSTFVEALLGAREGGLWVATRFDGLLYWPGRGDLLQPRSPATAVTALFEDRAGRLWVASAREGVMAWENGAWRKINAPDGEGLSDASCFVEDAAGRIWIGLRRGHLVESFDNSIQLHALGTARIHGLHADSEGNVWIATERGLFLRKDGRFAGITRAHGLLTDQIQQILDDAHGNLWLSSRAGIFRMSKRALIECAFGERASVHSTVFAPEEGLAALEGVGSVQPAAWRTTEGKLCFATDRGVAVIDPVRAAALDAPIPVRIEEARVDNNLVHLPLERSDALELPPRYQHLKLRFAGLSLVAPERTQFRYRVWGIDPDWIEAGTHRLASYGRLPAGEHRFEVIAQTRDGTWPQSGSVLLLRVAPHYWETGWFRAAIVAGLAAIGGVFWIQHAARRREISAVRQQITRDLHDDIGSNLGSIALLTEALQKPSSRSNNEQLLQEVNRIARATLDSMRDTIWFVDPGKDTLADLVSHLRQIAESMLKNTPHEFHAPDKPAPARVPLEVKRGVVLIFKEALHNAVRHSGANQVQVFTQVDRNFFHLEIVDDGRGFDPGETAAGHGLGNMKHRAEKLRANLEVASAPGKGTRIRLTVNLLDV